MDVEKIIDQLDKAVDVLCESYTSSTTRLKHFEKSVVPGITKLAVWERISLDDTRRVGDAISRHREAIRDTGAAHA